jgi:predicted nucleotidyltransferase
VRPTALADVVIALRAVLAAKPQIVLAHLFGSVARGTARVNSDLDLAVDAEGELDLLELARELGARVGREVQVVRLCDATIPLLDEIVRDGVLVHEGRPNAAAQWRTRALCSLEIDRPWYARMRDAWLKQIEKHGLSDGQS